MPSKTADETAVRPGAELQRLIDEAPQGVLNLPAGTYLMQDSLRLRSNLHVRGGGQVILKQPPIVSSPVIEVLGFGHSEFRVADPNLFKPGMGVKISTDISHGFFVTVGRIVDQIGETFFIDAPFNADYYPSKNARVSNVFPIVAGYNVEHATLDGVIIEGVDGQQRLVDGCRSGGVFLIGCQDVRITHVEVRNYTGDAVSFQQCADVYVDACELHHNAGHGLHPGSGTVRYVMAGNGVHDNLDCGVYYCLRTTHSICRDNEIANNHTFGISFGERDTDHLLTGNKLRGNHKGGITFRTPKYEGADRVTIRGNTFEQAPAEQVMLDIGPRLRDICVVENTFHCGPQSAIRAGEACERLVVANNRTADAAIPSKAVQSKSAFSEQVPKVFAHNGPDQLSLDGARHLRVQKLPKFVDRTL